jgi:hypothetical protein
MSPNKLHDFIHVVSSIRKQYTKVEYFSKHILFTTIYLLQKHKLKHNNYSEQKINLNYFIQDN